MVYAGTLLNCPDCTIAFTLHKDAADKKLGSLSVNMINILLSFLYN